MQWVVGLAKYILNLVIVSLGLLGICYLFDSGWPLLIFFAYGIVAICYEIFVPKAYYIQIVPDKGVFVGPFKSRQLRKLFYEHWKRQFRIGEKGMPPKLPWSFWNEVPPESFVKRIVLPKDFRGALIRI